MLVVNKNKIYKTTLKQQNNKSCNTEQNKIRKNDLSNDHMRDGKMEFYVGGINKPAFRDSNRIRPNVRRSRNYNNISTKHYSIRKVWDEFFFKVYNKRCVCIVFKYRKKYIEN